MNRGTCNWRKTAFSIVVFVLLSIACNSVSTPEPADQDTLPSTILNLPDAVDAGLDQTVEAGVLVEMSATPMAGGQVWVDGLSGAGNNVELQVFWQQLSGPQISLTHSAAPTTSFVAPGVQSDAVVLSFRALLRLEDGTSYTDVVQVTVTAAADDDPLNPASTDGDGTQRPTADAGDDLFAQPGEVVVLDGSASSDPAGLPLDFSWSQSYGPEVVLAGSDEAVARFVTPHIGEDYHLAFTLTVSNGVAEALATVMVHVTEPGDGGPSPAAGPIAADAGPDHHTQCSNLVTLDGGGSTGADLTYLWVQTAGIPVHLLTYDEVTTSFIAPVVAEEATLVFELIVNVGDLYDADEVLVFVAACPDNPDLLPSYLCPGGCDDENPCTIDECVEGTCLHSPVWCPAGEVCNPDSGDCVEACAGVACDDGDPCTTDTCDPDTTECVFTPIECAEGLFCVDGTCVECESDAHCDDLDLCTTDACVSSACVFTPVTCPEGEFCVAGACVHCEGDEDCDDGDSCTLDTCNLATGECSNDPVECPGDLLCLDGECVECRFDDDCPDDGNDCTDTVCNAVHECAYPPLASGTACGDPSDADCDDPDTCDGDGNCLENLEPFGTLCSVDGNDCTDDMCDGSGTCTHPAKEAGSPCGNQADTQCDDPDTCDGAGTCLDNHEPADTPCDDDQFCTGDDFCSGFGYCDQHTGDPCAEDETCDEGEDACIPDGPVENSPPTVSDQSGSTFEDTPVLLTLYGQDDDGDDLTFFIVEPPAHGTLGALDNGPVSSATATYTPASGYLGSDSFTFYASDGEDDSNTATFSLTISETPEGTVYYVDDDGPDQPGYDAGQPIGSINHPYSTIQAAAHIVDPGDTVLVKPGTYPEQVDITRSGAPGARITFAALQARQAVMDGQGSLGNAFFIGQGGGGGNHVTLDGFTIKNYHRTGIATSILVYWADNVIVRNCHVFRDDYPGHPGPIPDAYAVGGIRLVGPSDDCIIEYNHVHHCGCRGGIRVVVSGTADQAPTNPIVRWNHVHHVNMVDIGEQNHAIGIALGAEVVAGTSEYNLVHHCDDGGTGSNTSGGHIFRYNIVYLCDHLNSPGGNGYGIKTKPDLPAGVPADIIAYNVSFLNQSHGFIINWWDTDTGNPLVVNNVSYGNNSRGMTVSNVPDPELAVIVKNNICLGNGDDDIHYSATLEGFFDFNFQEDGEFDPAVSPHTLTGDPGLANIELLHVDANGDGTPDVLDALNDPSVYPDAESAIQYAREVVAEIFGLNADSPCLDAGVDPGLDWPDLMGRPPFDDPSVPDPWPGVPEAGVYDMGPLERLPSP